MAPPSASTRRPPSRATAPTPVPSATASRVTRLRSAKEPPAPSLPSKPSGFLAKSKEGLRKVSDKMKEKDIGKKEEKAKPIPKITESSSSSESLQAFLRIRPPPTDAPSSASPYLEPQGDKEVLMRAPSDPSRPHLPAKPPLIYSFNKVFPPSTPQSSFFTTTTLPLVEKLLQGENGLMFAYGVSNSGKSYTISGGQEGGADDRGVLPRSIDVVFNSIKGMESKASLRCTGMADVEMMVADERPDFLDYLPTEREDSTQEAVKVDRNYSFAVFVSSAEVYNEKIFDLLDAVLPSGAPGTQAVSGSKSGTHNGSSRGSTVIPRGSAAYGRGSSAWAMSGAFNSSMNLAALANGGAGVIRRRALALKNDPEGSGKYIAGLNEIRVRTREEALAVFRAGQRARQVFGTLANRESSRSHGIFTIKVVRIHNGAPDDPDSAQVSRLAVVDLAGSERTRNTGTTGDRLKEAGNINKSLMVLGQCLEVLRSNQQKLAAPGAPGLKKRLAVVPFRHSKLTEIFQNFFVGDGRAVMIVNVNPYDTGFDENSHVMRFSAIAREVQTTASNKVSFPGGGLRRQISTQFSALKHAVSGPMKIKVVVPVLPKDTGKSRQTPQRDSNESYVMVEEELEVVEEDAEDESEDERDVMVDHLFEELKELKERLYEAEMRNASIEAEVREEVAKEMQEAIQKMHDDFAKRLQEQFNAGELKSDRKIDILSRAINTPAVERTTHRKPVNQPRTHLESTPEIDMDTSMDTSADASFVSVDDDSVIEGSISPLSRTSRHGRISDITDPFVTGSSLRKEVHTDDDDGDESDITASEVDNSRISDVTQDEQVDSSFRLQSTSKVLAGLKKVDRGDVSIDSVDTEASEDVLGNMSTEGPGAGDLSMASTINAEGADVGEEQSSDEVEEEVEEDNEEEEEGEEDEELDETETESEEESEVEFEADSDFEAQDEKSVSSASPSPPRRLSTKRRPTVSPTKRATPAKPAKPVKGKKTSPAKRESTGKVKDTDLISPRALQERTRQESVAVEENSDDEVHIVKPKKKRTLGKKIVMEDDMNDSELKISGAEVKRMGSRGLLR